MNHSTGFPALAALLVATPTLVAAQPSGRCENGTAAGYACDRVDLVSRLARHDLGAADTVMLNDIWGWTDTLTGRDYALVGKMDGTAFVDVTDPAAPRFLGHLPATAGAEVSMWRDIKVFSDHAFIVASAAGAHGMQVFDLTWLRGVEEPRGFAATTLYTGVDGAINVAVNEETGFAYLVGSTGSRPCGRGLHMADIRNPVRPSFAGCFAHAGTGRRGTGYAHDAQCVTYRGPDEDYRGRDICLSMNETSLSVADVTDRDNPVPLAAAPSPTRTRAGSAKIIATFTPATNWTSRRASSAACAFLSGMWRIWRSPSWSASTSVLPTPGNTTCTSAATDCMWPTSGPACACSTSATPRTRSPRVTSTRPERPGLAPPRTHRGSGAPGASIPSSKAASCSFRGAARDSSSFVRTERIS